MQPKYLKLSFRIWWLIFIIIYLCLLILMGITFACPTWVYTDNTGYFINSELKEDHDENNYVYDGSKFQGSLTFCIQSCEQSYFWLANKWCDEYKDIDEKFKDSESTTSDPYLSICSMFYTLFIGSAFYIAFEVVAMIAISVLICTMICYWKKINCIWLTFCCSGSFWVFHSLALILFMGFSHSNYSNNCKEFPDDGERPNLCAGSGPGLSLFIMIVMPIIVILFCMVSCKLQNKYGCEGLSIHYEVKRSHKIFPEVLPEFSIYTNEYNESFYAQPAGQGIYTQPKGVIIQDMPKFDGADREKAELPPAIIFGSPNSNK